MSRVLFRVLAVSLAVLGLVSGVLVLKWTGLGAMRMVFMWRRATWRRFELGFPCLLG